MKICLSQINPVIGDLDGNTQKIIDEIGKAKEMGAELVVFPELTICGYLPEDLLLHGAFIESIEQHLETITRETKGIMALVGLPRKNVFQGEKPLLNSAAVIYDGHLVGFQDKWLLPTYDVFQERRYFEPGHHTRVWELNGKRVAIVICEDMWQHAGYVGYTEYARDPIQELVAYKPDILINLSASPYQMQKFDVRVEVCAKAAKTLQCPVVYCCQVGANDQLIFDGYSLQVNEKGELVHLGKGFEEDRFLCDTDEKKIPIEFSLSAMEELHHALVLGVKDYFRKQGFQKACLGLSGGLDSAVVACIVAEALGPENVLGVSMPSRFTSGESKSDAEKLAENLGIEFTEISIEENYEAFLHTLAPEFKGKEVDVTEENLQARIRGTLLMALSNKHGYVVVSTGNKSETALGYCTLYGDMCGGLGVIGDVTKTKAFDLARWINENAGKEIIPQFTIDRPPSAELREGQIDLDSLPDYKIVDDVLEGYVENYMTPSEISEKYQIPQELVINLIQKIHRAEYKRRQGPPVFRVSKKSFGIGRRYPIVQGWR